MNNLGGDVEIGKSNFNRTNFEGRNWFYLKDNQDNPFRVLPPLFSLAKLGQYAKWFAVHRQMRGTNNRQTPFLCIEEKDRKTNVITRHCPVCSKAAEFEARLEIAKQSGATEAQLKEARVAQVYPLGVEKKYYLNVVNQEGKIGLLAVGKKMFDSLEALCKTWEQKGYDLTGVNGLFLNFTVSKRFKGDRDAVHKAEVLLKPDNSGGFRPVEHVLTPEVIARLKTEAADLTTIFKEITAEQMALLAESSGQQRSQLIDKIFAIGNEKPANAPVNGPLNAQVPGAGATMVGRMEISGGNVTPVMPQMPPPAQPAQPNNNVGNFAGLNNTSQLTQQGLAQPAQQPVGNGYAPAAPANAQFSPTPGAPMAGFGAAPTAFPSNGTPGFAQPQTPPPAQPTGKSIGGMSDEEFFSIVGTRAPTQQG